MFSLVAARESAVQMLSLVAVGNLFKFSTIDNNNTNNKVRNQKGIKSLYNNPHVYKECFYEINNIGVKMLLSCFYLNYWSFEKIKESWGNSGTKLFKVVQLQIQEYIEIYHN